MMPSVDRESASFSSSNKRCPERRTLFFEIVFFFFFPPAGDVSFFIYFFILYFSIYLFETSSLPTHCVMNGRPKLLWHKCTLVDSCKGRVFLRAAQ